MQIRISAPQFSAGDAFRAHAEERLRNGIEKYTERAVDASVTLVKEGHEFRADCTARVAPGAVVNSEGRGADAYAAFDQALERLEKQLRRRKRHLEDKTRSPR